MYDQSLHDRRWWILAVLIVSLFAVMLDNTIVNVALPTLARRLDASTSELQWMVDAYVLVYAGLLMSAGALGDRFGRRRVLLAGLAIFGFGSLASAFSGSASMLIALRAVMGVGGALIAPSTLSITRSIFTMEERPKAIAIWTSVAGLGMVTGPIVAGLLLDRFAWGSIFLINVPVVAVAVAGTLALIPEIRTPDAPALDLPGAVLSVGVLATLVYGTIEAPGRGLGDPAITLSFALAAIFAAAFLAVELRSSHPMIDIRIFGQARLSAALLAVLLSSLGMMGSVFFLSQYLQSVLGFSTLETGVSILPLAIAMGIFSPLSALFGRRIGARPTVAAGLGAVAAGLLVMAQASPATGYPLVAVTMALIGAGMALSGTPVTTLMIQAMPESKAGVASAINNTAREVGGALGVAILGSIAAPVYGTHVATVAGLLPAQAGAVVRSSLAGAVAVAGQLPGPIGEVLTATARAAFVSGMTAAVVVGAIVALAGAGVALAFLPGRETRPVTRNVTVDAPAGLMEAPEVAA